MHDFLNQHVLLLVVALLAGGGLAVKLLWRNTPRSCYFTPLSYDTFLYACHCLAAGGGAAAGAWFVTGISDLNVASFLEEGIRMVATAADLKLNSTVTPFNLAIAGIAGGVSCLTVFFGGVILGVRSADSVDTDEDEEDEDD